MSHSRELWHAGMRIITFLALSLWPLPVLAQQAAILVRHAEQAQTGGGMMDGDPPLSETGRRRAFTLVEHLRDAGVSAIVTSQYLRARETAAPLAAAMKIEPEIVLKDDEAGLVGALRRQGGAIVLVVGHSDTIPAILKALGHLDALDFPKSEFNNAWILVPRAQGTPVVTRVRF
jgi:broad specificity phosphatase PhoE